MKAIRTYGLNHLSLLYTFPLTVQAVGVALVGLGLLTVFVETRDWRDYFEQRIKNIVIQQDYVNNLSDGILSTLQTSVLKARFKDPSIDRPGSFFDYFRRNLDRFMVEPYRENARCEISCDTSGKEGMKVTETIAYVCKKSGSEIQKSVDWGADLGEFTNISSIAVSVKYPQQHSSKGELVVLFDSKQQADWDATAKAVLEGKKTIKIPLDTYKDIDDLIVIVDSEYVVPYDHFQYWQMAHPTRNFDMMTRFPEGSDIQIKPLVLNEELCRNTSGTGYRRVIYDSWMLPKSGVAWRIFKSSTKTIKAEATPQSREERASQLESQSRGAA